MAKISDYGNYDTDKSQAEVEKFQETGVLPVSGKYADNGNMTTKNVKLADLVGGGGAPVPTPASGDVGKVLTVDSSENIVWDDIPSSQPIYGEGLEYDSNTNTLKFNYFGSGGLMSERTTGDKYAMKVKAGNGIKVDNVGVSIDTDTAEDGQVLSYDDTTKKVKWVDAGGGGGAGLPDLSQLIGQETEWSASTESGREIKLFCDITSDGDKKIVSATNLRWGVDLSLGSGRYFYFT